MTKEERLEKLKELQEKYPERSTDLITIGAFTYGVPVVMKWDTTTRLTIGKFCSIGANVQIYLGGEHHTERITTYPFEVLIDGEPTMSKGDVKIGNDVWIGNNVQILSGVTIGDGAVIGAGSVVARDVQPYTIVAGSPARLKKLRACWPDIADIRWWDWPVERIAEAMPMLMSDDVDGLYQYWEEAGANE